MEQHAVPQHVSAYQFKLVGDMTLRQFFQLAGGLLVSLLFYASHLHPVIKWPAMIFFAIVGAALAFLPLEDRPLEKWILAFFKSIYSPTIYFWKKGEVENQKFFQDEAPTPEEKVLYPKGDAALTDYLSKNTYTSSPFFSKLEGAEKAFLTKTNELFGGIVAPVFRVKTAAPTPQPVTPNLYQVTPTFAAQAGSEAAQAQFSVAAAPPNPPETPNTVTGQVFDSLGKIVEGAILEIRDSGGRPVRALRSNKLGHFIIVTPLINDRYEILVEKEGLVFDTKTFEAKGSIIPPILIKARSLADGSLATGQQAVDSSTAGQFTAQQATANSLQTTAQL